MDKAILRNEYKLKRSQLSSLEIKSFSEQIFNQIKNHFDLNNKVVHVFIPITKFNEVETIPFIEYLYDSDCTVITSITHFKPLSLSHCIINRDTKFETDSFGIPTPVNAVSISEDKIDIVIIPLLAFDKNGGRVGYGKGLYDRFLSNCKNTCIKIGVSFFGPTDSISGIDKNDVFLDYCVSPDQFYTFK